MTEQPVRVSPVPTSALAPEAAELLRSIEASGFPGWAALGVEQGRAAILQMKELAGPQQPIARFEAAAPVPVLIYMHRGGWVFGQAAGVDALARTLANGSGCAVLSVNYRLAPEHKYPAALDDVLNAIKWVAANARRFGIDEQRVAIGGDSSGANLAAAASLFCRDRGLPQTLIICAAVDPLLHENKAYARRLAQVAVRVELAIYPGMFHGFWRMAGVLGEARRAIDHAAGRLRTVMGAKTI